MTPPQRAEFESVAKRGKRLADWKLSAGRKRGGKVENVKRVLSEDELAILIPWLPKLSETISDVLTM